jgi:hypothetical protein
MRYLLRSDNTDARKARRASNRHGALPNWLVSASQGRRWQTRREAPGSIETRNKFPDRVAPLVERDNKEDGFVHLGWEDTGKGGTVGGARLTIETGSLSTIGINTLSQPDAPASESAPGGDSLAGASGWEHAAPCPPLSIAVPSISMCAWCSSARSSTSVPKEARTIRRHASAQVFVFSWRSSGSPVLMPGAMDFRGQPRSAARAPASLRRPSAP